MFRAIVWVAVFILTTAGVGLVAAYVGQALGMHPMIIASLAVAAAWLWARWMKRQLELHLENFERE